MLKHSQLFIRGLVVATAVLPWAPVHSLVRSVSAQSISTAQLDGVVKDATGAIVGGATVTARDSSKGLTRSDATDSSGHYQLLQLPPGSYTITVQMTGFEQLVQNNVVLTVGEQANLPFTLAVGSVDQKIVVSSDAEIIETERSSQSTTGGPASDYETCRPMGATTSTSP